MEWPENTPYRCPGNLSEMLCRVFKTERIGSEIKCLLNDKHIRDLINDHKVTYEDLSNYRDAKCSMIYFQSSMLRRRAELLLDKLGKPAEYVSVDDYRDVILQQANYFKTNSFYENKTHNRGQG